MALNIALVEPEIPQNTGNIARTCAAAGIRLHLIDPLGFKIDNAKLKRAGLDYWHLLDITYYTDLEEFFLKHNESLCYFSSTKAANVYSDVEYPPDAILVFGKETAGLPEWLLEKNLERTIRIPMLSEARSLNLSNAVAIVAYEALRQQNFKELQKQGVLTGVSPDRIEKNKDGGNF